MQKHPNADLLIAIANGEQPQGNSSDGYIDISAENALIRIANNAGCTVRIKPKTITINGIEVPAPVTEPLEMGKKYWTFSMLHGAVFWEIWNNHPYDEKRLKQRAIHLNKEAAQAHFEAVVKASGGEV